MSADEIPELDLVSRVQEGDRAAFEELMGRYHARVLRLALRFTGSKPEAEEILQEVFLTVYQKLGRFEGKSAFSTWLYRVTVNASLMRMRSRSRAELVALDELDPEMMGDDEDAPPGPDERLISEEALMLIERAMEKMDVDLKTVFILRDIEGFSNEETAEIMGLTVAAVKSRLHRGRAYLRPKLKDLNPGRAEG